MATTVTDRRGAERVPTHEHVTLRHMRHQAVATARDVSAGGIFLYCDEQVQPGAALEVVLLMPPEAGPLAGRWVSCYATVVRVEGDVLAGDLGIAAKINYSEAVQVM
jgi:hypothetical protein